MKSKSNSVWIYKEREKGRGPGVLFPLSPKKLGEWWNKYKDCPAPRLSWENGLEHFPKYHHGTDGRVFFSGHN